MDTRLKSMIADLLYYLEHENQDEDVNVSVAVYGRSRPNQEITVRYGDTFSMAVSGDDSFDILNMYFRS